MSYQHVIISGNVIDGVTLVGPFDDPNTAHDYAQGECNDEWSVGPIYTPVDVAPSPEPMAWRIRTGGTLDYVTKYRPDGSVSLSNITPLYAHPKEPSAECNDLREQYDNLKEHYAVLRRANDDLDDTRQSLLISERRRWDEIHALRSENHTLAAERSKTLSDLEDMTSDRDGRVDELNQECDRLDTENNELSARVWALQKENDRLVRLLRDSEIEELSAERDNLRNLYENVVEHRDSLFDALGDQTDKNYQLRTERDNAVSDYKRLERQHRDLNTTDSALGDRYNTLRAEYKELNTKHNELHDYVTWLQGRVRSLATRRDS